MRKQINKSINKTLLKLSIPLSKYYRILRAFASENRFHRKITA
jgi:hypothetical protein